MHHELVVRNFGLLFATFSAMLGILGIVLSQQKVASFLAIGQIQQSVLILFVVAGSDFVGSNNLQIGGLIMAVLLIIQTVLSPPRENVEKSKCQDRIS